MTTFPPRAAGSWPLPWGYEGRGKGWCALSNTAPSGCLFSYHPLAAALRR
ncbi:hypothetical protein A33M_2773 [Rhodovulum sp. PH10]|nr:hypothetical protein A33M_2773 [Rhodovulum sp. PH10]